MRIIQNLALMASAADEAAKRHLPFPPWRFAVIARSCFLTLLAATFAFRGSGTQH